MHALIMTSATYQQASVTTPGAPSAEKSTGSVDPENRLYSRFNRRRLDFEQLRDALLAVTGELDPTHGGKPRDLLAPDNRRRSIYGLVDRQFLPGTFRVFDFANPDLHVAQRHTTTVPQQGLFFLNHPFMAQRARAVAAVTKTAGDNSPEARIARLHEFIFQRAPSDAEKESARRFLRDAQTDLSPGAPKAAPSAWQYGWGEYDPATKRVKHFEPLPHFTGSAWQGGPAWPDAKLGWAQLTANGGHAGNDRQHAVIRRWTAAADATVAINGIITHEHAAGDGVHAHIVSSRDGELRNAVVHNTRTELTVASVDVRRGDTLDFIVDYREGLHSDTFGWAPVISKIGAPSEESRANLAQKWDAKKEFAGPATPQTSPLTPWEQYAQVLLLSNEFVFVD